MALVAPLADLPVDVPAPRTPVQRDRAGLVGLAAWCTVVVVALVWGTVAVRSRDVGLHAAPFKGHWAWHGGWRLLPAVGLGVAVAGWGPRVVHRLPWRRVPVVVGVVATAWTVLLALGDGVDRLTAPLVTRFEYEPFAARLGPGDLGHFLATYVDRLDTFPIHVQGHPPGPVVLAWTLDRLGLGGAGWLAAVAIGAWGVAVGAALVTVRTVADETAARRAAPALAVLPAAVWAGTSVDPIFAALVAVAIALAVQPGPAATVAAGLVFGTALVFSYGAVPLIALLLVAVLLVQRHTGARTVAAHLGLVGVAAFAVLAVAALAGFSWPAGLEATRTAYWQGIGSHRPGLYTTLAGNVAALAVAVGPATAAALARLVRAHTPLVGLVGAAVLAVVAADVSQVARGEVERIWLPFVPWLALAAPGDRRVWLAAQVAVALVVQSLLVSPW